MESSGLQLVILGLVLAMLNLAAGTGYGTSLAITAVGVTISLIPICLGLAFMVGILGT